MLHLAKARYLQTLHIWQEALGSDRDGMGSRLEFQRAVRRTAYLGVIHGHHGICGRVGAYRQLARQSAQLYQDRSTGCIVDLEILGDVVVALSADMHGVRALTHQRTIAERQFEPAAFDRQTVWTCRLNVELDRLRCKQ